MTRPRKFAHDYGYLYWRMLTERLMGIGSGRDTSSSPLGVTSAGKTLAAVDSATAAGAGSGEGGPSAEAVAVEAVRAASAEGTFTWEVRGGHSCLSHRTIRRRYKVECTWSSE